MCNVIQLMCGAPCSGRGVACVVVERCVRVCAADDANGSTAAALFRELLRFGFRMQLGVVGNDVIVGNDAS